MKYYKKFELESNLQKLQGFEETDLPPVFGVTIPARSFPTH